MVVFRDGHRIEKLVAPHLIHEANDKVKGLRAKGVKAHLVLRTDKGSLPPPGEIREMREAGMLWCPYCRAWRWFVVPKFTPRAEVLSDNWYINSLHRQGIKACKWCHISVLDWWVCKANGIFHERTGQRRRRKRRTR